MSEEAPKTPKAKKPKAPAAEAAAPEVAAPAAAPAEAAAPERKEITAKELLGEELGEVKVRRAKGSKNITTGICHILATFNNTKVTITDANGKELVGAIAGDTLTLSTSASGLAQLFIDRSGSQRLVTSPLTIAIASVGASALSTTIYLELERF